MQTKKLVKVDLLEFIKSGKFGSLKLGYDKAWVLANFPPPDDRSSPNHDEYEIFSYGSVELHFKGDTLFLIFSDNINRKKSKKTFYTGKSLKFTNKWIFAKRGKRLKLHYVIESLLNKQISYKIDWQKDGFTTVEVITQGNINLLFEPRKDQKDIDSFELVAMSLYDDKIANL